MGGSLAVRRPPYRSRDRYCTGTGKRAKRPAFFAERISILYNQRHPTRVAPEHSQTPVELAGEWSRSTTGVSVLHTRPRRRRPAARPHIGARCDGFLLRWCLCATRRS